MIAGVRDPGRYALHRLAAAEKEVLVIAVSPRREGFAQLQSGAVVVRRGASNIKLFGEELATFLAERKLSRFETTPTGRGIDEVSPDAIRRLSEAFGWESDPMPRLQDEALVEGLHRVLSVSR